MSVVLANNAVSKLASSLTAGATALSVTAGEGSRFPSPTGGDWSPITVINGSGALEILRCTARAGDVLTVVRAQEGTSAQSFSAGDRVELRLTGAVIAELQAEIDALEDDLDAEILAQNDGLKGLILGLEITWITSTSISVGTGSAYIPSSGKILPVTSPINLSSFSLTSNTWYYLYLYDNAGTPAIELVTTAPTAPYTGTARTKTGDTSRRFIASLRSNAGVGLQSFQVDRTGMLRYRALLSVAPFRVVSSATNTTPTTVDISAIVPQTTQTARIIVSNQGTPVVFMGLPEDTASIFDRVAPGTQIAITTLLNGSRQFSFHNSAAGGSATFDVAGYGMDR